jgi:hypothetical protein
VANLRIRTSSVAVSVDAEHVVDDPADRVVGQTAVESLDQIGSGEVANAQTGLHHGVADTDKKVWFAGARRTDQTQVLSWPRIHSRPAM